MTGEIWAPVASYDAEDRAWKDAVSLLLRSGIEAWGSHIYAQAPVIVMVNPEDKDLARRILAISGGNHGRK